MAKLYNLARMTTATTGAGTITLGVAVSGHLTIALAGGSSGDVIDYAIEDGPNSEHGFGTYTVTGPTLTLTRTVTKSTNGNAPINLSGLAEVFISPRAETLNDATLFTTGTLADARLSSNVPLKNTVDVFTQKVSIASTTAPANSIAFEISQDWASSVATNLIFSANSYGDAPRFSMRAAGGSQAAPTAVGPGSQLGSFNFRGYYTSGGPAFSASAAAINVFAINTFTSTDWGTYMQLYTTAAGTTAVTPRIQIHGSGGVVIGSASFGLDQGEGTLAVTTKINVGAAVVADSSVTVNYNTAATVTPTFTSALHAVGADGVNVAISVDAFGASPVLHTRNANGTLAAKTAVTNGTSLGVWVAQGWNSSAYATGAQVQLRAATTWTGSTLGSEIALRPTPNNGTVLFDHTVARQDGTLSVGSTTLGGPGSIVANAGIGAGNVAPIQSGDIRGLSTAKAWVRFVGTIGMNSSFQVSSVTRTGAGDYTVNFTTAQPDTAYMFLVTCDGKSPNPDTGCVPNSYIVATTALAFKTTGVSGAPTDNNFINVAIFH
jgi:hypothetical protein